MGLRSLLTDVLSSWPSMSGVTQDEDLKHGCLHSLAWCYHGQCWDHGFPISHSIPEPPQLCGLSSKAFLSGLNPPRSQFVLLGAHRLSCSREGSRALNSQPQNMCVFVLDRFWKLVHSRAPETAEWASEGGEGAGRGEGGRSRSPMKLFVASADCA